MLTSPCWGGTIAAASEELIVALQKRSRVLTVLCSVSELEYWSVSHLNLVGVDGRQLKTSTDILCLTQPNFRVYI